MHVELRDIDSVTPYDKNPRRNDAAVDAVARSIDQFGFKQPIVVDKDGVIVVGHTRWKAAKQLGMRKVPVCPQCGHYPDGFGPPSTYRLELATWGDPPPAPEWCGSCGRQLVYAIQFDRAG